MNLKRLRSFSALILKAVFLMQNHWKHSCQFDLEFGWNPNTVLFVLSSFYENGVRTTNRAKEWETEKLWTSMLFFAQQLDKIPVNPTLSLKDIQNDIALFTWCFYHSATQLLNLLKQAEEKDCKEECSSDLHMLYCSCFHHTK